MQGIDPIDERCDRLVRYHGSHSTVTYHEVTVRYSTAQRSVMQLIKSDSQYEFQLLFLVMMKRRRQEEGA